jgi:hypothetical protein
LLGIGVATSWFSLYKYLWDSPGKIKEEISNSNALETQERVKRTKTNLGRCLQGTEVEMRMSILYKIDIPSVVLSVSLGNTL